MLALTLALSFLSIAGIPPLAGFLSKINGYYYWLGSPGVCILIVLSSVIIAGVYYVRLVQIIIIFSLRVKRIFDVSMTVKKELI